MSDYENIKGIIRQKERIENEDDKIYFERVTGKEFQDELYESIWGNNLEEKFVNIGDILYEFIEYAEVEYAESFINTETLTNGDIKFHTRFYNGGACLSDMLEDIIRN